MTPLALNEDKWNSLQSLQGLPKVCQCFNFCVFVYNSCKTKNTVSKYEILFFSSVCLVKICKMSSTGNLDKKNLTQFKVQLLPI